MKTYHVNCNKRTYRLTDNDILLGTLSYPKWYSQSAKIHTDNLYTVETHGVFGQNISIQNALKTVGQSKLNWNLSLTLKLNNNLYTLKTVSLFSMDFVLLNMAQQPVLGIKTKLNWWNYDVKYSIHLPENQQDSFSPEDLLYLIHNCNYYMMMNLGRTETLLAS